MIAAGSPAPDFSLPNPSRQVVRLSDFHGRRHVVLAFHPLAFTPICSTQARSYERERAEFDALGADVLVISTDTGPAKGAWAKALGVTLEMLSDFHPQGAVARAYGVMGDHGLAQRAVVLVDRNGVVRWTKSYGMDDEPSVADVLAALRAL